MYPHTRKNYFWSIHSVKEHLAKYKRDNRAVYNIMDQICNHTDLYPYVKRQKFKRDGRGTFYIINSRWLCPNHANATASEAEIALQMSKYDGRR